MTPRSVLIVDDELDIQSSLSFALQDEHYEVLTASSPKDAERILATRRVDVGLFDVWFPEGDGLELLEHCRKRYPQSTVVMMSGHGNIELALKSIRLGAYDFLEKPLELEKVLVVLRNAFEALELRSQNRRLSELVIRKAELLGQSKVIENLRKQLALAAPAEAPVLILGENGAGKEIVARLLHSQGSRAERPFVKVSCAGLSDASLEKELFGSESGFAGRFEEAADGIIFFDEIASLSPTGQEKLRHVLEEKSFERTGGGESIPCRARILVATNRDLPALIREGHFREDLFFRLNVLSVQVPPLRERGEDALILAEHFLKTFAKDEGRSLPALSPTLKRWIQSYDWPGNVRELKNLVERMLIMNPSSPELGLSDLPEELQNFSALGATATGGPGELRELRADFEKKILSERLDRCGGNVTRTAESLGIERAHLHRKLRHYGIKETTH